MEITGRITRDAEVHTFGEGKQVVNFRIAVPQGYKSKSGDWIDQTQFIGCAFWLHASIAPLLTKGRIVSLTGSISLRQWEGSDGSAKAGPPIPYRQYPLPFRQQHDAKPAQGNPAGCPHSRYSSFLKSPHHFSTLLNLMPWHIT